MRALYELHEIYKGTNTLEKIYMNLMRYINTNAF